MNSKSATPLLLAYYGDDFTGSTDVMESLSRAGLKTILFLDPPGRKELAKFPGLRAFGIAGNSRSMSPRQMEQALPLAFQALKASRAPIIHYKTCSTFDSSPTTGSIGKAIDLGARAFGKSITPLVIGVPVLGRYVVFGNLFARSGLDTDPFRLDRHPTMSRHPVTPMGESDVRLLLGKQSRRTVELVDVLKLRQGRSIKARSALKLTSVLDQHTRKSKTGNSPSIVLFDTLEDADLPVIGHAIASQVRSDRQLFCAGSSGIEYALVAYWREQRLLPSPKQGNGAHRNNFVTPPINQIIAVSGSCSPVTARQIDYAVKRDFVEIPCDSQLLADETRCHVAVADALDRAQQSLAAGRNVIFHTASGVTEKGRSGFARSANTYRGGSRGEKLALAGESLGKGLGEILRLALLRTGSRFAVVCGGDTSTQVARALGIEALEFVSPAAPGAPLCRIHAPKRATHACGVIFKGGQVGRDSFFTDLTSRFPGRGRE